MTDPDNYELECAEEGCNGPARVLLLGVAHFCHPCFKAMCLRMTTDEE